MKVVEEEKKDELFSRSKVFHNCDASKMAYLIHQLEMNFDMLIDSLMEDSIVEDDLHDNEKVIVELDANKIVMMNFVKTNIDVMRDITSLYCKHDTSSSISKVATRE